MFYLLDFSFSSFSVQIVLSTRLFSLAWLFQTFTKAERYIPENSQGPSFSHSQETVPGTLLWRSSVARPSIQNSVESAHFLFQIINVLSGSKFPPNHFSHEKRNLGHFLNTFHTKNIPIFSDLLVEKTAPFCLWRMRLRDMLRLVYLLPLPGQRGPKQNSLLYFEASKQAIEINYWFLE